MIHIFFDLRNVSITVPSFIILGYVRDILGREGFLPPSIREQPQKRPLQHRPNKSYKQKLKLFLKVE